MAKVRRKHGRSGYAFVKELGGAPDRQAISKTARVLLDKGLVLGRVLDFGCGLGFDADQLGWDGYDPYYRPRELTGLYYLGGAEHSCGWQAWISTADPELCAFDPALRLR
ncbi:MAG: hypothetical protein LW700_16285 [Gemmataceae bacterium]|nr:hypothetical protein [Gemmataceae bacterium]